MIPELASQAPELSKVQLCRLLGISRSEAYRKPAVSKNSLVQAIERIVTRFLGYGYRRVHLALKKEGIQASAYEVRKTMREHGLGIRKPRPRSITRSDPSAQHYENLLARYAPTRPGEMWVTDMTLIKTRSGGCYLAVMMDLYTRKAIAWHLSRSPDLGLALNCLDKALARRKPLAGWIHHSDRGSVYTATEYVARVRASGGRMSMSRTAKPTDNPHAESFFKTLKKEEVQGNSYDSFLELEASLGRYIEGNYNLLRMHSALGFLSPDEFEAQSGEVG